MTNDRADALARRVAGAMLANEGTGQAWGIEIEEAREGYSRIRMKLRADMLNGHGKAHGGMVYALADTAFAYACNSRNVRTVGAQATMVFLDGAEEGEVLVAEAQEQALVVRSGVYNVSVRTDDRPPDRRVPGIFAIDRRSLYRDRRERLTEAFICDAVRTPIGRYGGALSSVRADDLAAIPIRALKERNHSVDWAALDDIILGCANQAGEDNRNLARMAGLLAGLPDSSGGVTLNRLCGSGLDAVAMAARAIRGGDADLIIAGGSESMSRAPFVMPKAMTAFDRNAEIYDTTIGWRFVNPKLNARLLWRSTPCRDGRECRRGVSGQPRGPGQVRAEKPAEDRRRAGQRPASGRDRRRSPFPQRKGDAIIVDTRRASAPDQPRGACPAEADRPRRRVGHRRQCLGRQRRSRRADHRQRGSGQTPRPDPARPDHGRGGRRRSAADHGHRPGPGDREAAAAAQPATSPTST